MRPANDGAHPARQKPARIKLDIMRALYLLAAMLRCVGAVKAVGGWSPVRPRRGLPDKDRIDLIETKWRLKKNFFNCRLLRKVNN